MRYLLENIKKDLTKKMVFLAGPRQVGKTTLALELLGSDLREQNQAYINWEEPEDKKVILDGKLPGGEDFIVFDEIHKYHEWRNLIKGFYDSNKSLKKFLITGSARLDYYSQGGDSLQGRYLFYRLHPFSLKEFDSSFSRKSTEILLERGGFPEPLFADDIVDVKRWHINRLQRVLYEDIFSLEKVREVEKIKLLAEALPSKLCSPVSIKSLKEDLAVAHETVETWLSILRNIYFCYRVTAFGPPNIRSVKKESKIYLWDWSLGTNQAAKFENLVASQLLKHCHFIEDTMGEKMELKFIKTTDKRELDFIVLKNGEPEFGVEVKSSDKELSKVIKYLSSRTKIPYFYQVHLGSKDYELPKYRARILPFEKWVKEMNFV